MPRFWHRKAWRIGRVCFRWFRIACLLLVLAVLGALAYLNQVGLPGFVTDRIVEELHSRGLELRYERMRLDFDGAIVAERIRFGALEDTNQPSVFLESVTLGFNAADLRRLRFTVESLALERGRVRLPLNVSNEPPARLLIDGLKARVEFLPGDEWRLSQLTARTLGTEFRFNGILSNASAIQHWPLFGGTKRGSQKWQRHLREVLEYAGDSSFATNPRVTGVFRVDAADPKNSLARLNIGARGVTTPHGEAGTLALEVNLMPADPAEELPGATLDLRVGSARTRWGAAEELELHTKTRPLSQPGGWPAAGLTITATQPRTPWGDAEQLRIVVSSGEVRSNFTGFAGDVEVTAQDFRSKWGAAGELWVSARATELPHGEVIATGPHWAEWAKLAPYELRWRLRAAEVATPRAGARLLTGAGHWRAPNLTVDWLDLALTNGTLKVVGSLDVESRVVTAQAGGELDPKRYDRLLGEKTLRWFDQFGWEQAPRAGLRAGLVLPAWTNAAPAWETDVVPTLWLDGALTNGAGSFRGVPYSAASGPFRFTNQTWFLPDITITRPEGVLHLEHISNERTRDYSFRARGVIDPQALRPMLGDGARRALDLFQFTGPPEIEAAMSSRWRQLDRTDVQARLRATNFTFRGEQISDFSGALSYTNRVVHFRDARLVRPEGGGTLEGGRFEIDENILQLTNVVGRVDPMSIARMIGPVTARALEPYQFGAPPLVKLAGTVHTRNNARNDLRFRLEGGPFHWTRFNLPEIQGDLHWVNDGLTMTNFAGAFYDGKITGSARFDFSPPVGTDFAFSLDVWEADLRKLVSDITPRTNKVEGVINGRLTVTHANTADWTSWQGGGEVAMRDGLLWDVPLFGFLSVPLNSILPGIGQSRAEAAKATYTITNSLITTDDMKIEAGMVLLKYRGTVDFDTRVNARVEAEVFRDTGAFGRLVNFVLTPFSKLLEYKVTGTITAPVPEAVYFLPRMILSPLQPKPEKEPQPAPAPPAAPAPEPPAVPPQ